MTTSSGFRLAARSVFFLGAAISCGGGGGDSTPTSPGTPIPIVSTVTVSAPAGPIQLGQAYQFSAVGRDNNGLIVSNAPFIWSVSPATAANVSVTGVVTPLAAGGASIKATSGSVSGAASATFVQASPPNLADVFMAGKTFIPTNTTVKVNGTVRFNFENGNPHNVIFARTAGAPTDIQVTQNVVISRVFAVTGIFAFDCTIHPGMSAQVTVVP
ncbi:MAG: Ig-like domain-containing protein [Gemmatimonadaceae bacterium]|nr:Ig-like domain-containing protein [Gemmatimonadaceae bacterium]